jgi:hypothetical protein
MGASWVKMLAANEMATGRSSSKPKGQRAYFTHEWSFLNNMNQNDIQALNLRVLTRHNHYITSLVDKSSYCVIYTFSTASGSWTKAGYEGTLFIYTQQPHLSDTGYGDEGCGEYGFCVLNRLSLENFWGEVNGGDIVLEDQYIITRSLKGGTRFPLAATK